MRLINCSTLQLEEFFVSKIPKYAILSHTWGNDEVSFADFILNRTTSPTKEGYRKIAFTCKQTLQDGLNYAWVDTCCIDKSSSSELSEAINSMFVWYRDATKCYAYLSDVSKAEFDESFPKSRWFTRGWTLQELLAPRDVMFYDRDWNELGTKLKRASWISEITTIDRTALLRTPDDIYGFKMELDSFCVAKKMSWASHRETTRAEDIAYCLLGIFNVNMPLLYGEGKRAFIRLQEEIMKNFNDNSILAWGLDTNTFHPLELGSDTVMGVIKIGQVALGPTLASSPKDFKNCGDLKNEAALNAVPNMTNQGLKMQLPLVPVFAHWHDPVRNAGKPYAWIGLLGCSPGTDSKLLGILLFNLEATSDSSKQVKRAFITNKPACYTMVVGPRVAAQSALEKVTIVRSIGNRRDYGWTCRQIVINESQGLRDINHHVSSGTGLIIKDVKWRLDYEPIWDQATMLLTIEGTHSSADLLYFCFEPQWNKTDSEFTVFMRTASKRAIVRRGSSFSEEDKQNFYDYLEGQSQQDSTDEAITDGEGNPFQVVVTINEKLVYDWQIFELNVDVVSIENSKPSASRTKAKKKQRRRDKGKHA